MALSKTWSHDSSRRKYPRHLVCENGSGCQGRGGKRSMNPDTILRIWGLGFRVPPGAPINQ
jgi:hypothetical protein